MLPSDFGFFGSLGVWGVPLGPIFLVTQGAGQPRRVPPMWGLGVRGTLHSLPQRPWGKTPAEVWTNRTSAGSLALSTAITHASSRGCASLGIMPESGSDPGVILRLGSCVPAVCWLSGSNLWFLPNACSYARPAVAPTLLLQAGHQRSTVISQPQCMAAFFEK